MLNMRRLWLQAHSTAWLHLISEDAVDAVDETARDSVSFGLRQIFLIEKER